eukprot:TRINITY_DN5767_c0_g1_i1.p1 TRINITY_DN5767_c0_g1~~TRINITY_DN5767_c0_g1_i1.p1  ORF type:complete len:595 (+),score=124.23 TRINITY_DN5767_c0_g1_i1:87-1787(+)
MPRMALLCLLACAALCAAGGEVDLGYEGLFEDADEECDGRQLSFKGQPIPSYVRGVFMQTGPAKWSWRSNSSFTRKVTHALDGFSKVHRWEFREDGSVVFSSKFLQSGFMANSKRENDIAFNVMAQPMDPPKQHIMKQFTDAPNDNQNVNVVRLGDATTVLSDSATLMQIDPASLAMEWEFNGQGCKNDTGVPCTKMAMKNPLLQICGGGSAHPFFDSNGDLVSVRETNKYTSIIPGKEHMSVYRVRKDALDAVEDIVTFKTKRSSYTHQMGLAKGVSGGADYAVIAAQPIHTNSLNLLRFGTLDKGFEIDTKETTKFLVAPITQGAAGMEVDSGRTFFFGHVVNSWLSADGKQVFTDINMQDAIFFDRYSLNVQRSKQLRDAWPTAAAKGTTTPHGYQTVTRYTIDLATQKQDRARWLRPSRYSACLPPRTSRTSMTCSACTLRTTAAPTAATGLGKRTTATSPSRRGRWCAPSSAGSSQWSLPRGTAPTCTPGRLASSPSPAALTRQRGCFSSRPWTATLARACSSSPTPRAWLPLPRPSCRSTSPSLSTAIGSHPTEHFCRRN